MAKGSSAIVIKSDRLNFYKHWLQFIKPLTPVNKLRDKELEILAAFLYKREELSNRVKDVTLVTQLLFSQEIRESIMQICKVSYPNYYVLMSALKRVGIIINGDLSKKVIPELVNDKFTLVVSFTIENKDEYPWYGWCCLCVKST